MNKVYLQPPSLVSALETEMYERTKVLAFPPTKQQVNDLSGSLLKRLFTFTPNCVPQIISYLPLPDSCNHSCICSDMHSYISSLKTENLLALIPLIPSPPNHLFPIIHGIFIKGILKNMIFRIFSVNHSTSLIPGTLTDMFFASRNFGPHFTCQMILCQFFFI